MNIQHIEISKIKQNINYRASYKENEIAEFMSSIKQLGLIEPITVRETGNGEFEVVQGNKRFVACKKLGAHTIAADNKGKMSDIDFLIIHLTENMMRSNPSFSAVGAGLAQLRKEGLINAEIAARLSKPVKWVRAVLNAYDRIPKSLQDIVRVTTEAGKRKDGMLSLYQMDELNNLRATYNIPKNQYEQLLQYARKEGVGMSDVRKVAKLLGAGVVASDAIAERNKVHTVRVSVVIDKKKIQSLEKKYGMKISKLLAQVTGRWIASAALKI